MKLQRQRQRWAIFILINFFVNKIDWMNNSISMKTFLTVSVLIYYNNNSEESHSLILINNINNFNL